MSESTVLEEPVQVPIDQQSTHRPSLVLMAATAPAQVRNFPVLIRHDVGSNSCQIIGNRCHVGAVGKTRGLTTISLTVLRENCGVSLGFPVEIPIIQEHLAGRWWCRIPSADVSAVRFLRTLSSKQIDVKGGVRW